VLFSNNELAKKLENGEEPLVVVGNDYYALQERTRLVAINALNELQGRLRQWQKENFDNDCTGPEWMALGATEELGEVAHILVKAKQRIREHQAGLNDVSINELADGVADTVIYLMQLCSHVGIDFGRALFTVSEEVMQRDWRKNKIDGINK
jgi:NTP pyrophosphatase (non-canonical NTP hydrolase)